MTRHTDRHREEAVAARMSRSKRRSSSPPRAMPAPPLHSKKNGHASSRSLLHSKKDGHASSRSLPQDRERRSGYEERQDLMNDNDNDNEDDLVQGADDLTIKVDVLDADEASLGRPTGSYYDDLDGPFELEELRHQAESFKQEREELAVLCETLQATLQSTRKEMDLMKVKSTVQIGKLELLVDSLKEDRKYLVDKCHSLEDLVKLLRLNSAAQDSRICSLEREIQDKKQMEGTMRAAHGLDPKVSHLPRKAHSDSELYSVGLPI